MGLRCDAIARELAVRGECRMRVAGHVGLGHDHDVPFRRVVDDSRELLLGVEASRTPIDLVQTTDLREQRPALDLDTPALVVREVQVQGVDLEHRDLVDEPLDLRD
jgi:hypothetical protein